MYGAPGNLDGFCLKVVNTTSKELSDVEVQASVWDLDGNCPYFKSVQQSLCAAKESCANIGIQVPEISKPKACVKDYTLLEPYRKKQIPLKITCNSVLVGPKYELEINIHNTSTADFAKNALQDDGKGVLVDLLQKVFGRCGVPADNNRGFKVVEMEGSDPGVAFFLRFSVHNAETEKQDTRILPVHYSDNYFSLVPGESMSFKICFAAPTGMKRSPHVMLRGWNYPDGFTVFG